MPKNQAVKINYRDLGQVFPDAAKDRLPTKSQANRVISDECDKVDNWRRPQEPESWRKQEKEPDFHGRRPPPKEPEPQPEPEKTPKGKENNAVEKEMRKRPEAGN